MNKLRIYIDTSVIGGCFDEEFAEWSNKLFDEFIAGKKIAVISQIVTEELANAPDFVKNRLKRIEPEFLIQLENNEEAEFLATNYVKSNAISAKFFNDALHIAIATINKVDLLASWNFKHIVNYNRIMLYNSINIKLGYKYLEIRSPKELTDYEKEI